MQDSGSTASSDEDGVRYILHVFKTYTEARHYAERLHKRVPGSELYKVRLELHMPGVIMYFRAVEKYADMRRLYPGYCQIAIHSSYFTDRIADELRLLVRCNHDDCIERRKRLGNGGVDQFFSWPEPGQPDSGSSVRSGETTTGSDG